MATLCGHGMRHHGLTEVCRDKAARRIDAREGCKLAGTLPLVLRHLHSFAPQAGQVDVAHAFKQPVACVLRRIVHSVAGNHSGSGGRNA